MVISELGRTNERTKYPDACFEFVSYQKLTTIMVTKTSSSDKTMPQSQPGVSSRPDSRGMQVREVEMQVRGVEKGYHLRPWTLACTDPSYPIYAAGVIGYNAPRRSSISSFIFRPMGRLLNPNQILDIIFRAGWTNENAHSLSEYLPKKKTEEYTSKMEIAREQYPMLLHSRL